MNKLLRLGIPALLLSAPICQPTFAGDFAPGRVAELSMEDKGANFVAISRDGGTIACLDRDGYLSLFEDTGRRRARLKAHEGFVSALAISDDGTLVATAGPEKLVRPDGTPFTPVTFSSDLRIPSAGSHQGGPSTDRGKARQPVFGSPHDLMGRPVGCVVKLWDVRRPGLIRSWTGGAGPINHVAFSGDGHLLTLSSCSLQVKLRDITRDSPIFALESTSPSYSLDWGKSSVASVTPAGCRGVTTAAILPERRPGILLWDAPGGQVRNFSPADGITPRFQVAISPDGKHFAISKSNTSIRIYNVDTLAEEKEMSTDHPGGGSLSFMEYSPDGSCILSADEDGILRLWDVERGCLRRTLESPVRGRFRTTQGPAQSVRDVAFLPTGLRVVTGGRGTLHRETQPGGRVGRVEPTMVWDVRAD